MNRATLIGNVGRDPEARTFPSGDKMVSFSVATSDSWRDKATGERKERVEWHNVAIFNEGLCRVAEQYVRKGSKICVEGKIQSREYTDKDGNQRRSTEIVLDKFGGFLELLGDKAQRDEPDRQEPKPAPAPARSMDLDDDIPF